MPFQPSPETRSNLDKLGSSYRIHHRSPTLKKMPDGTHEPDGPGFICIDIFDIQTGQTYHKEQMRTDEPGASEPNCLDRAVRNAFDAEKPLTKAQAASLANKRAQASAAENAALKAKIAELEAQFAASKVSEKPEPEATAEESHNETPTVPTRGRRS